MHVVPFPLLAGLLAAVPAFAAEPCPKITSLKNALECAELRAPEVQKAEAEWRQAKAQVRAAGQWKNPELGADSFHGKSGGENSSETEIALGIPLELGGKIGAREAFAEANASKAEANLALAKADARANVLLKLHRLRQLAHEQEVVDESVGTFTKLVNQYAKRFKLSPEQEMSAAVFRMSKSEYELKRADLYEERAELDSFFQRTLGVNSSSLANALPASPRNWPKLEAGNGAGSPLAQKSLAELRAAQAELEQAKGEAWPTVVLGPSMKLLSEGGKTEKLYGFNLSLPLPLFNFNGAGKEAAAAGAQAAEIGHENLLSEQAKRREELLRVYEQSVAVLSSSLSHQEIEKKHTQMESMFQKGVVPSSLVIEAHRTFVDLEAARNQRELKALSALSSIYALDGKTLEIL